MSDSDVFILSAVRTPVGSGKTGGALSPFQPVDLAAAVMKESVRRAGVDPARVEDVVWGVVTPIGDQGANLARLAALKAGFPVQVPGVSLNRMCGSSQQAVHFAAQAILAGDMDIVIAGGTEMMSHQSLGADYPAEFPDVGHKLVHQGESAELMAEKWKLTREQLDDYAYQTLVRPKAVEKAAAAGLDQFAMGDAAGPLEEYVRAELTTLAATLLPSVMGVAPAALGELRISLPWRRLFEVEVEITPAR